MLTGGVDANPAAAEAVLRRHPQYRGGRFADDHRDRVDQFARASTKSWSRFKGTGDSEIILDHKVADKQNFPSIDITRSGTRGGLLVPPDI